MDVWFCELAGILPRGTTRSEKLLSLPIFALLRARRESLFLLTETYHGWLYNALVADLTSRTHRSRVTAKRLVIDAPDLLWPAKRSRDCRCERRLAVVICLELRNRILVSSLRS